MRLTRTPLRIAALTAVLGLALGLAGCGDDEEGDVRDLGGTGSVPNAASAGLAEASPTPSAGAESTTVAVTASDTACELDPVEVPAGPVVFDVDAEGPATMELYVLNSGGQVVTERESIAVGAPTEVTVVLNEGEYTISCRPDGKDKIDVPLQVVAGANTELSAAEQKAVDAYRDYVEAQVADTIAKTKEFVAAVKADDIPKAKSLYAPSRFGWESIEPVAEAFGDIDPAVDLREADLEEGDEWTGWHVIEKALWEDETTEGMGEVGDQLLVDLDKLADLIPEAELSPTGMANGAKELLDEVASGKITGEEEAFSHTDLVDFKANLDGARKVFDLLKDLAEANDPELVATLEEEFDNVDAALQEYEEGEGYVSYDTVTEAQRRELSDVVNALGEPLSKLAAAVVG